MDIMHVPFNLLGKQEDIDILVMKKEMEVILQFLIGDLTVHIVVRPMIEDFLEDREILLPNSLLIGTID